MPNFTAHLTPLPMLPNWGLLDGSLNAPPGTPQFPNLLDVNSPLTQKFGRTLKARPPWKVAGVDYHVGIDRSIYPTNASLKDPNTILNTISGASGNNTTKVVLVNGNNVTLDGYDFSLNGGWMVQYQNPGTNLTVSNCNFVVGANGQNPFFSVNDGDRNLTITQCEFDGGSTTYSNGAGSQNGTISINTRGTTTVTYCIVTQSPNESIVPVVANNAAGDIWVIKYNVFGNAGMGFDQGAHGDWIQTYCGTSGAATRMTLDFNLWYQFASVTGANTGPRTQGLSLWSAAGNAGLIQSYTCNNNTYCGTGTIPDNGGPYVSYQVIAVPKCTTLNMEVRNNYYDPSLVGTGSTFNTLPFWFGSDFGTGSPGQGNQSGTINGIFPPTLLFSSGAMPAGNTNQATGALLTSAECHLGSS